ncbi:MAG: nucleotide exchange factor GrpE [Gammaproteobacteria bacterium]
MAENNEAHTDLVESEPEVKADPAAPSADDTPADAAEALEKAQAQAEENLNKYMRLAAEMENLRKRTLRDVEHAHKFGIERFANELLAVNDSLEMALASGAGASVESLMEGTQATLKLLLAAMEKSGVEIVDPEGEPFDPQLHEAMTVQPSDTAEPGSVLQVIQKGYQLNGRLLRPARVIVAAD